VLHARLTSEAMEDFLAEARHLSHLVHPHIVRVLEFGVEDTTPFLVMDYTPHGSLRQRHPKGAPVPLSAIVPYVKQVAAALQHAHDQKLIHRDVNPENMLLGSNLVLGDAKHYLGLTSIFGDAPVTIQHALLQGGYFMMLGDDGSSFFCYRQPDNIHVSYVVRAESEDDLNAQAPTELLRLVQHATSAWHPPVPELVTAIDPESVGVRGYYDRDPIARVREGRLWLIGDAAHPMCPFQGQGANIGMVDSLKLAQYFADLVTSPGQTGTAAKAEALETDIITRGRKAVLDSRAAARRLHLTNRLQQGWRNFGFRTGNLFIQGFSRHDAPSEQRRLGCTTILVSASKPTLRS